MTTASKQSIMNRERVARSAVYCIGCCIIFIIPELIASLRHPTWPMIYARPTICVFIFCVNYFFLINRYFFDKNKVWKFISINVLMLIIASIVLSYPLIDMLYINPQKHISSHKPPMHSGSGHMLKIVQLLVRDIVLFVLSFGLSIAARLSSKWRKWDSDQTNMLAKQKEMELQNLKNQLNPHFLFNTLNNIYALIAISPEKAQNAVHELSKLLRYTLYDSTSTGYTSLDNEVKFVQSYIGLMHLRISPNVQLQLNTDIYDPEIRIAPLLFITIIENAFKHGICASKPSFINVDIKSDSKTVCCSVTNSNFAKNSSNNSRSGIGLQNLRKRLSLIYPDSATLVTRDIAGEYNAVLTINIDKNTEQ